jgi:hypothetical protein
MQCIASEAPFRCSSHGRLPVSPTNIRLGWKRLPGTKTLAYYKNPYITDIKKFYNIGTGREINGRIVLYV